MDRAINKLTSIHIWHTFVASLTAFLLAGCGVMAPTTTPTPDWQPMPTYIHYVPPSDVSEYRHYTPSESFNFHLEFDYPSYWWLQEHSDEVAILSVFLGDPRFLTLPTPSPSDFHPTPNDFGSVDIWIMPSKPDQTPDTELESHKQSYSEISRMTVLGGYKATIDGHDASVLEYQTNDPETSPSLMFNRRVYFMVNGQVYEIIFTVAEKERGSEFEKGYEYFFNSLKILP